ncbi:MAG: sigma-70 family RNA polymerase sigma factor [Bacteriovoracaceae bacterium]|nr:sigma-70 family RNA polymerase sigma factor [Bacteriovoracaceae bacterium]
MSRKKTTPKPLVDVDEFLPTVRYWARHYAHRAHQVLDFEDLVVVGMMGLMDAASKYNPQKDTLFKTYAEFRIRGEIIDELRRQDWMTRSERRKQKLYRKAHHQLEQNLGRNPTNGEMAKILPFKSQDLDRMRQYDDNDSIRVYQEGDLPQESGRDTVSETIEAKDEVHELLTALPELHRRVVEKRYFEDAPLSVIAEEIGLSEGRVSQLHSEALILLKNEMDEDLAA